MSYIIPTDDPDFVYPERYGIDKKRERKVYPPHVVGDPAFAVGDLVMLNGGIYLIRKVRRRYARHGKGKGDYIYDVGAKTPAAENRLKKLTDEHLRNFKLQKIDVTDISDN